LIITVLMGEKTMRVRARFLAISVVGLSCLLVGPVAGASAATSPSSGGASKVVDFGILGKELTPGQSVSVQTLSSWGVSQSEIDALPQSATSTEQLSVPSIAARDEAASRAAADVTANAAAASPDPRYAVVASWPVQAHQVYLQQGYWTGTAGFGYAKITQYHNLTVNAVKATTMYPRGKVNQGGTTWQYETPVGHVECRGWWVFRRCRVTEVISVYAVVNHRPMPDGTTFGVVTSYCSKYQPRCPEWAKNALNI
jgi:hypothetical protein